MILEATGSRPGGLVFFRCELCELSHSFWGIESFVKEQK